MPAQAVVFVFYFILSVIVFPFTALNLLIIKTNLVPNLKSFVVKTASMEPMIPKDSVIYTLAEPEYKKGDIIAFQDNGNVTHRIIDEKILGSAVYFSTKGDANTILDESLIPIEKVYGKVIGIVPLNAILIGTVLPTLFLIFSHRLVFSKTKE